MIFERINLYHISMPLVAPFVTSFGKVASRECVLLEVSGAGLTGWGECVADREPGYSYETTQTAIHVIRDFFAPLILGKDYQTARDLQDSLSFVRGHPMAKAGLEMALWDLLGKQHDLPLQQILAEPGVFLRKRVPVGVSVGLQETVHVLIDTVGHYLSQGYGRIKLKIKPGRDIGDTRAIRLAFPEIPLQVDANSAYALGDAPHLKFLDDLNLLMIEQPLDEDDLWDHSKFQALFQTSICLDESILSARHALQALEMSACRVINIKSARVGGLLESLRIHDLCLEKNIPVWCGGMLETGVGRAANLALASLPGFILPGDISATDRYYVEDIIEQRFVLNADSTIDVPQKPGLGVEIDHRTLDKYTLAKLALR